MHQRLLPLVAAFAAMLTAQAACAHPSLQVRQTAVGVAGVPGFMLLPVAQKTKEKSYKVGSLVIEAPWIRATPGGAQVAAGYLRITNSGSEPDRLIGGTVPVASAVEVHEMTASDGIMKMRQLEKGLEIEPGKAVELKPGGNHLMFIGLREGLKAGQTVKGNLIFDKAGSVDVEFAIAPIGAQSGGHKHH